VEALTCCKSQGYCETYKRELWGRQFELSHGLNCTEEEFRKTAKMFKDYPTVFERVTNFGRAAVEHLMAGGIVVKKEVEQERLRICHECPFFDNDWCRECGCYLPEKVTWAESVCGIKPPNPIRWGAASGDSVQPKTPCCGN
jgi:hypothetical protein